MQIKYPITFLYYHDLDAAVPFYRDVLDLKLDRDQGWCKIFRLNDSSCVGLVDQTQGSVPASEDKPVLLTLVVDDVDAWYQHLQNEDVAVHGEPMLHEDIGVYCFFCEDPEGYTIEIQKFVD